MKDRGMQDTEVSVPRAALAVLILLALVGLVGIGWLMGRESGQMHAAPSPPATAEVVVPAPPPEAAPTPAAEAPAAEEADPSPTVDAAERRAVEAYFARVDPLLRRVREWDDPDVLAEAVITRTSQGDPRGFEQVVRANEQAGRALQAIEPPDACRGHHRLAVEVVQIGSRLVAELGASTLTGDTDGLGDLTPQAEALKAKINELRELRRGLADRFGLPRPPTD